MAELIKLRSTAVSYCSTMSLDLCPSAGPKQLQEPDPILYEQIKY